MTLPQTEQEFVDFIQFWEWEYTRRSPQWRKIFAEQTDEKARWKDRLNRWIHYIRIGAFGGVSVRGKENHYKNAESIIMDIANKVFNYHHPVRGSDEFDYEPFHKVMFDISKEHQGKLSHKEIQDLIYLEHDKIYNTFGLNFNEGDRLLCFNIKTGNINTFNRYIESKAAWDKAVDKAAEAGKGDPSFAAEDDKEYQNALTRYEYAVMKERKGKAGKWKNNEQRAIGLWIYDYCIEHNCGGPTAFAALRQTKHLQYLGLINDQENDRSLERWLAGTKACVEAADVLPLTG